MSRFTDGSCFIVMVAIVAIPLIGSVRAETSVEHVNGDLAKADKLEPAQAIPLVESALRTYEAAGEQQPEAMRLRARLAALYLAVSDYRKAEELLSRQIEIRERYSIERRGMVAARSLLVGRSKDPEGYGLYSYLLFAYPPNGRERQRYLSALKATLQLLPAIEELANPNDLERVSVVLIPIKREVDLPGHLNREAESARAAEIILDAYNYARAQAIFNDLGDSAVETGPYLISSISGSPARPVRLRQDMSHVSPELVSDWIKYFIWRAAEPRSWTEDNLKGLWVSIRTEFENTRQVPSEWIQLLGFK